jgi:prephenate dehydrogenase
MWESIFTANARPLAGELRAFARLLDAAASGLEQGDISPLMSYFGDAARIAGALDP